jgi:hypothetical protein
MWQMWQIFLWKAVSSSHNIVVHDTLPLKSIVGALQELETAHDHHHKPQHCKPSVRQLWQ